MSTPSQSATDGTLATGYAPGEVGSGIDTGGRYLTLKSPDSPAVNAGVLDIRSSATTTDRPKLRWDGDIRLYGPQGSIFTEDGTGARTDLDIRALNLVLDIPNGTLRLGASGGGAANRLRSRDPGDTARRRLELEGEDFIFDMANGNLTMQDAPSLIDSRGSLAATNGDVALIWQANNVIRVGNNSGSGHQPIAASAFNVNSDSEKKIDTTTVDPAKALAALSGLKVYDYTRTDNGRRQRGVMAQDVAAAVPIVVTAENGDLGVDLYGLATTHTAAIQSVLKRLETVEAKTANMPAPPTPGGRQ